MAKYALSLYPQTHADTRTHLHSWPWGSGKNSDDLSLIGWLYSSIVLRQLCMTSLWGKVTSTHTHTHIDWSELLNGGQMCLDIMLTTICKKFCRVTDWEVHELMYPQELGERGKPAFYQGRVAQAIVDVINQNGGVMTLDDLSSHDSEVVTPISTEYKVRNQRCRSCVYFNNTVSSMNLTSLCV